MNIIEAMKNLLAGKDIQRHTCALHAVDNPYISTALNKIDRESFFAEDWEVNPKKLSFARAMEIISGGGMVTRLKKRYAPFDHVYKLDKYYLLRIYTKDEENEKDMTAIDGVLSLDDITATDWVEV